MINSCDTWSTGFHGNDQCLSYMINSLSYQWSTVVINDQQSFMAMINVYLTWSTVFHPMIDVDHAWTVMNDIVHKAMNNANCIYTLTFIFLLSSSPTSGERRGGGWLLCLKWHCWSCMKYVDHPMIGCWSWMKFVDQMYDRILIMGMICWSYRW